MQVVYVIYDKRFFHSDSKILIMKGDSVTVEKKISKVLCCDFVFFEEKDAEEYAKKTWGDDYSDWVVISPLQSYIDLQRDIHFYTRIKPEIHIAIKKCIAKVMVMDVSEIKDTDSFRNDIGTDSLDFVEIIMEVEKEFNIRISDEDAEEFRTVRDLILYVGNILLSSNK